MWNKTINDASTFKDYLQTFSDEFNLYFGGLAKF